MKKFFRITLKGTPPLVFFDYEVPENAQLPQFWSNVISAGCVVTEKFIVMHDQVASIQVVTMEQAQVFKPQFVQ